jgi:hypothetical protein
MPQGSPSEDFEFDQADLLEEIIFWQCRQMWNDNLIKLAKCKHTLASTEKDKLQRSLQQCTAEV